MFIGAMRANAIYILIILFWGCANSSPKEKKVIKENIPEEVEFVQDTILEKNNPNLWI